MLRPLLLSLAFLAACESPADTYEIPAEESVHPGINAPFQSPDLDVEAFVERFEGESREVYQAREQIVSALDLEPGQVVADVGAGTGLFLAALSRAVGPEGKVYAIDIAPRFVEYMAQRAEQEGLTNVETRICSERSVELPRESIDVALICDVYHHFEFPHSSMGSIRFALRPGGEVVIVDFKRVPGESSEWILNHVRAGEEQVISEMESFGFDLVERDLVPGLKETWAARFRKR